MMSLHIGHNSFNFIKKYWYASIVVALLMSFAAIQIPYISQKIQSYAVSSTEEMFGTRSLAPAQEQKIRDIAQKLEVKRPFHVRKMNAQALKNYGYHNAFAYYPQLLSMIPLGNEAFMYISEGFFEDLSEEEQVFLISHELVHIKEEHTKSLGFLILCELILITFIVWTLRKRIRNLVAKRIPAYYGTFAFWGLAIGLWFAIASMGDIGIYAYMRHNERVADTQALEKLACHEGLLKITDRWQREFKMQLHNNYYGIFSDHPSCAERIAYCNELQQKSCKEFSHEN